MTCVKKIVTISHQHKGRETEKGEHFVSGHFSQTSCSHGPGSFYFQSRMTCTSNGHISRVVLFVCSDRKRFGCNNKQRLLLLLLLDDKQSKPANKNEKPCLSVRFCAKDGGITPNLGKRCFRKLFQARLLRVPTRNFAATDT